jgi:hemerythrin-like domain-containing protein
MKPTDVLRHEHKIILMVLEAAEREARGMEAGGPPHGARLSQAIEFCRNFTDRCHHAKEEKHLFPKMKERSPLAAERPLGVMMGEHEEGRRLVAAMADGLPPACDGDRAAVQVLAARLIEYVDLLRAHIDKEDNILFPLADKVLREEDQKALIEAFEKIEAVELGEGVHEKYHHLAHVLAEQP